MTYDAFITYNAEDYEEARQVCDFLTHHKVFHFSIFMVDRAFSQMDTRQPSWHPVPAPTTEGRSPYEGDVENYCKAVEEPLLASRNLIIVCSPDEFGCWRPSRLVSHNWHKFIEELRCGRKKGNILTILTKGISRHCLAYPLMNCFSFPITGISSLPLFLAKEEEAKANPEAIDDCGKNILMQDAEYLYQPGYMRLAYFDSIDRSRRKILIADTHPTNLRLLEMLFTDKDCPVLTARSSEECVELARKEQPAVILIDTTIAGENSVETVQTLKAAPATGGIPLILMSLEEITYEEAKRHGFDNRIVKPFINREIINLVAQYIALSLLRDKLPDDQALRGKKILAVDDVKANTILLKALLFDKHKEMGYDVSFASNGREGYEAALTLQPDLILMDILMPEWNGLKAIEEIRKNPTTRHIPIVVLSAYHGINAIQLSYTLGTCGYLLKPYHYEEIYDTMKRVLKLCTLCTFCA